MQKKTDILTRTVSTGVFFAANTIKMGVSAPKNNKKQKKTNNKKIIV